MGLDALFRLAFATAPPPKGLSLATSNNSPDHYAKGTPSGIASKLAIALRPLVGAWFQVHIPPLTGVLLIFQSPYLVYYRSLESI